MHKQTGGTNISHANDNKPFNEYNGDDGSQGDYPIVNNDDIQAVININIHMFNNWLNNYTTKRNNYCIKASVTAWPLQPFS